MTTTTLADLKAQQAEIARAIAAHELPLIEAAQEALAGSSDLRDTLTAIRDDLPDGQAKTQIGNVLTVLNAVPQVLTQEAARVNALLSPAASTPTVAPMAPFMAPVN